MFSDEEYRAIIQPSQHRATVSEDQRFGVHFDYKDLCARLAKLEGGKRQSQLPILRDKPKQERRGEERKRTLSVDKRPKSSQKVSSKTSCSKANLPHSLSPALPKAQSRSRLRSLSPLEDLLIASPYKQLIKAATKPSAKPMLRKAVKAAIGRRL